MGSSIVDEDFSKRKYYTGLEVRKVYGIGRDALDTLVRDRKLKRVCIGRTYRYPVYMLERLFNVGIK